MEAWIQLFKKDFRLTRTAFLIGLVFNFFSFMFAIYIGMRANEPLLMFIPLVVAIVFHAIYFPIMLFISLKTESNQLHLWLHNPQPATALLLSKGLNGIVMTVISLTLLYVLAGFLILSNFTLIDTYWRDTLMAGLLIFVHIIFISIVIGLWVMFLWTLYQFLKNKIGRLSWFAVIGAILVAGWIGALFESTQVYLFLTEWGEMTYQFPTFPVDPITTFAGEYVYRCLIIIGLYFASAWIIDNKVEV